MTSNRKDQDERPSPDQGLPRSPRIGGSATTRISSTRRLLHDTGPQAIRPAPAVPIPASDVRGRMEGPRRMAGGRDRAGAKAEEATPAGDAVDQAPGRGGNRGIRADAESALSVDFR